MTATPARAALDELDALLAAVPGDWEAWTGQYRGVGADSPDGDIVLDYSTWIDNPEDHDQALRLTALIVALRNRAPAMLAAIRAAYAQHVPLVNSPGRPPACPECLGGIYADDPDEARSCGCWGLVTPICSSCADHHNEKRYPIQWPCPTVAALDEALGASGE